MAIFLLSFHRGHAARDKKVILHFQSTSHGLNFPNERLNSSRMPGVEDKNEKLIIAADKNGKEEP